MAHGSGKKTPTAAVAKATKKPETSALTFAENERVLCYEPDFTKVRVIYDAKIIKIDWVPVDAAVQTQQVCMVINMNLFTAYILVSLYVCSLTGRAQEIKAKLGGSDS